MRRIWIALFLLAMLPSVLLAHPGHGTVAHTQVVPVGPYRLIVEYADWPLRARKSNRMVIRPEGGIQGITARARLRHSPDDRWDYEELHPYPGIPDAWVWEINSLWPPDTWYWEFELDGPLGRFAGHSEPIEVGAAPGLPLSVGWLLGLFPLYGLGWFGWREYRRVKTRIAAEGGVHG
jgi:hypothetical protein